MGDESEVAEDLDALATDIIKRYFDEVLVG
jgi:hypothetical protein